MGDSAVDGKDSSCYALILPGMGHSRSPAAACSTGDRGQTGVKVAW